MKTPLNPLMFAGGSKDLLITVAGRTDVKLRPGKYVITMCGGGGAGGTRSMNSAGNGGAGARGDIQSATITITDTVVATVYVGAGGRTYANGGNGGRSDDSPAPTGKYRGNNIGGFGGGGGYPTYIKIGNRYYFANGGADDGAAAQGVAGNTTDFPGLASGRGGTGGYYKYTRGPGGAGANGGGASGGGGGGGAGNHSSSHGGGGGGGAGGSPDAGGGAAGYGWGPATNAANHHTTPTPAVDYLGQPVTAGWGIGGYGQTADIAAGNGADGWFYLTRVAAVAKEDFGFINETADEYRDYGNITDPVTETIDYGYLKE